MLYEIERCFKFDGTVPAEEDIEQRLLKNIDIRSVLSETDNAHSVIYGARVRVVDYDPGVARGIRLFVGKKLNDELKLSVRSFEGEQSLYVEELEPLTEFATTTAAYMQAIMNGKQLLRKDNLKGVLVRLGGVHDESTAVVLMTTDIEDDAIFNESINEAESQLNHFISELNTNSN